jgi:2-hydroxychromene-2-carboxylate isomerase
MGPRRLRFFYDFVCPYAYLASLRVEDLARSAGAELVYEPVLLGGIFRSIGGPDDPNSTMSTAKARYAALELERAAAGAGVALARPSGHPRRTVLALRAAIATGELPRAASALFSAYWQRGSDLEDPRVVRAALDGAGLDGARAVGAAEDAAVKAELRRRTDEAVSLGVFGVPSFVVEAGAAERQLFWGQDRLDQVRAALAPAPELDFYFDYSSPFSYLAATQVRGLCARTGARLRYKPLLLGALFKALGTPNVPLFEMPQAKLLHQRVELDRWAARWGVPFKFASRFPMNTVKALRLTLLSPQEAQPDVVAAIYRAMWVEDKDIADVGVLAEIAQSTGVAAAMDDLEAPSTKEALRTVTSEAEQRGVFGVPTFFVGGEIFWGQDRLEHVEAELVRQGLTHHRSASQPSRRELE